MAGLTAVAALMEAVSLPLVLIGADARVAAMNAGGRRLFGAAMVGRHYNTALRQPALLRPIGVHDVDLPKTGRVRFEPLQIGRGKAVGWIGGAQGAEDDLRAIRRECALRIVPSSLRQAAEIRSVAARDKDVHLLVVVPRIALLLSGGAELKLRLLLFARTGVAR